MKSLCLVCLLLCTAGCTLPFSGERDVSCKVNILGNTVEWKSKMAGSYKVVQVESEVAR